MEVHDIKKLEFDLLGYSWGLKKFRSKDPNFWIVVLFFFVLCCTHNFYHGRFGYEGVQDVHFFLKKYMEI